MSLSTSNLHDLAIELKAQAQASFRKSLDLASAMEFQEASYQAGITFGLTTASNLLIEKMKDSKEKVCPKHHEPLWHVCPYCIEIKEG